MTLDEIYNTYVDFNDDLELDINTYDNTIRYVDMSINTIC